MTFNAFMLSVLKSDKPNEQRHGQWAFNMLSDIRPDLANRMTNTSSDPFYTDDNLQAFWVFLAENWQ
jgi:hypothetical protein